MKPGAAVELRVKRLIDGEARNKVWGRFCPLEPAMATVNRRVPHPAQLRRISLAQMVREMRP